MKLLVPRKGSLTKQSFIASVFVVTILIWCFFISTTSEEWENKLKAQIDQRRCGGNMQI